MKLFLFTLIILLPALVRGQMKQDLCRQWKCISAVKDNDQFLSEDTLIFRSMGRYEYDSIRIVPYLEFHTYFMNGPTLFCLKRVDEIGRAHV